jgi:hypothetical protein
MFPYAAPFESPLVVPFSCKAHVLGSIHPVLDCKLASLLKVKVSLPLRSSHTYSSMLMLFIKRQRMAAASVNAHDVRARSMVIG